MISSSTLRLRGYSIDVSLLKNSCSNLNSNEVELPCLAMNCLMKDSWIDIQSMNSKLSFLKTNKVQAQSFLGMLIPNYFKNLKSVLSSLL